MSQSAPPSQYAILTIAISHTPSLLLPSIGLSLEHTNTLRARYDQCLFTLQEKQTQPKDQAAPDFLQSNDNVTIQEQLHHLIRDAVYFDSDNVVLTHLYEHFNNNLNPLTWQNIVSITPQIILLAFAIDLLQYNYPARLFTLIQHHQLSQARDMQLNLVTLLKNLSQQKEHDDLQNRSKPSLSAELLTAEIDAYTCLSNNIQINVENKHHQLNKNNDDSTDSSSALSFIDFRQAIHDLLMITDDDIERHHAE